MNLVLGAVRNLEIEYISPFLFSLYRAGYAGDVRFFSSRLSERTEQLLDQLGVYRVTVTEETLFTTTPVNSLRYFVYQEILKEAGARYDHVLLADVRDIVFQRNPFDFDCDGRLVCSIEDRRMTLGSSVINGGWIAAAYGKEALQELAAHPVSCSGCTLGPAPLIRAYVDAMVEGLREADARVPNIMHVIGGIDQGVHNYLLRNDRLPPSRLLGNDTGPILTLNDVDPRAIQLDEEDRVLTEAGDVAHIVHQYDRHPDLAERLLAKIHPTTKPE